MKNQIVTKGIVLTRTDFQEADRILTLLTPDHGKLRIIAKGVRRPRSKLAGGIELLSVSDISVLPGRGELGMLVSTRLITHYGQIVTELQRTMLAYDILKRLNKLTEDAVGKEFFTLLQATLEGLNDHGLDVNLTELWFNLQLLDITGRTPNLATDADGQPLTSDRTYLFDFENMAFNVRANAPFMANHIKLLRLCLMTKAPADMKQVKGAEAATSVTLKLVQDMARLG